MKKIKKIIFSVFLLLIPVVLSLIIIIFLPNEPAFKIANARGIESESKGDYSAARTFFRNTAKKFNSWHLISDNNFFGVLYSEKKYQELSGYLTGKSKKECSLKNEKISEFCENIFYLEGLTHYRLGENLKREDQKPLFEKAVFAFRKALAMNPENVRAKENIDFILRKFQQNNQQEDSGRSTNSDEVKNEIKEDDQNEEGGNSEQRQSGKEDSPREGLKDKNDDSRLPARIQEALEEAQKQLDEDQKNSRKGFNRSRSAVEKNNIQNQNPFYFMGNDSFFQNFFRETEFNKNINSPDEKDW